VATVLLSFTPMKTLWKYLRPHKYLILVSLFLAGIAQLLSLIDPIIFGTIIDRYASGKSNNLSRQELISGVLYWRGLALHVSLF
jgi:ATP-binding cassette subfamily B protein